LIFDRHICSLLRFGVFGGTERFLIVQCFHFSMVLKRIVHLAVPSENVSWRGKKITKSCLPTTDRADRTDGTWRPNARANLKKTKAATAGWRVTGR
jgi:hypothetical protein